MVHLGDFDRGMNDADLLEICSYLPKLKKWNVSGPVFTLTIDEAREWKRICPQLEYVKIWSEEGFSEEVKEVMNGLGITVDED
jgi:hypothetical protein